MQNTKTEEKTGFHRHVFAFRVDDETAKRIREDAAIAGMSPGRYMRERMSGRQVRAKYDMQLLNELRRQGGLLKMLATRGADVEEALAENIRTMRHIRDTMP